MESCKINDNRFMVIWGESGEADETINAEDISGYPLITRLK